MLANYSESTRSPQQSYSSALSSVWNVCMTGPGNTQAWVKGKVSKAQRGHALSITVKYYYKYYYTPAGPVFFLTSK